MKIKITVMEIPNNSNLFCKLFDASRNVFPWALPRAAADARLQLSKVLYLWVFADFSSSMSRDERGREGEKGGETGMRKLGGRRGRVN